MRGLSLTHPELSLFLSGEFLLHISCGLGFYSKSFSYTSRAGFGLFFDLRSFCYTSRAGFSFIWGVSLTRPMLSLFLFAAFLLHILCWLHLYLDSFCYTSRAGFIFMGGVSLTHPILALFFYGECPLHITCSLLLLLLFFFFFKSGEFLLHIPCFPFHVLVFLTHPVLTLSLSVGFPLHISCSLWFSVGSFCCTSHAVLFVLITQFAGSHSDLVPLSDFNFHYDDCADTQVNRLKTMLSDHGLTQLVDVPTHRCGHTLDWAVVRSDVSCLVLERVDDMPGLCDHRSSYVRWRSQHRANQSVLSHLETSRLCLFLISRRPPSVSQIDRVSVPTETLRTETL